MIGNPQEPLLAQPCGFGALAQLGERRLCKPEVTGSIPVRSIAVAISDRAPSVDRRRRDRWPTSGPNVSVASDRERGLLVLGQPCNV